MRISILVASVALASPAAAATPAGTMPVINPTTGATANCPPISRYDAARKGGKLGLQRLGELPAADLYKAVFRTIDGCVVPVIARYGIGADRGRRR